MKLAALVLGIIGNILSMLVFAAPLPTFWRIIKKGSIESFSAFPYVCALLSNMLWLYYGILDRDCVLLITICSTGCFLETFYLSIYLLYAAKPERITLVKQLLVMFIIYSTILVFTIRFAHGSMHLRVVGFLCALNSLCMYASPLTIMKLVITTKSVEYMPFLLSLSLFLCGGVWFAYAVLMNDLYLEISNGSGLCLGFVQLVLYALYCSVDSRLISSNAKDQAHMLNKENTPMYIEA